MQSIDINEAVAFRPDAVFCDSLAVFRKLRASGLQDETPVMTRAPALIATGEPGVVNLDSRVLGRAEEFDHFYSTTNEFLAKCLEAVDMVPEFAGFKLLLGRELWMWQTDVILSALLTDSDFTQRILIADDSRSRNSTVPGVCPPWHEWFRANKNAAETVHHTETARHEWSSEPTPSLKDRLSVSGLARISWKFLQKYYAEQSFLLKNRPTVHILRQSDGVRDLAMGLICRGYKLSFLTLPEDVANRNSDNSASRIVSLIEPMIADRTKSMTPKALLPVLKKELSDRLSGSIASYVTASKWLKEAGKTRFGTHDVILSNYPKGGAIAALGDYARDHNILACGVQHGVMREILENRQNYINYENTLLPALAAYSDEAVKISMRSPFVPKNSQGFVTGLPREYRKMGALAKKRGRQTTILFASTYVTSGYWFNNMYYRSDWEVFQFEKILVEEVFAKIPHDVYVKQYPTKRYVDADPITPVIQGAANVRSDLPHIDLRYFLGSARVAICVGASSTFAWCFASGTPMIYIDPPTEGMRLRESLKPELTPFMAMFDARDDDLTESLRNHLSQDIDEYEQSWAENRGARRQFWNETLGIHDKINIDALIQRLAHTQNDPA